MNSHVMPVLRLISAPDNLLSEKLEMIIFVVFFFQTMNICRNYVHQYLDCFIKTEYWCNTTRQSSNPKTITTKVTTNRAILRLFSSVKKTELYDYKRGQSSVIVTETPSNLVLEWKSEGLWRQWENHNSETGFGCHSPNERRWTRRVTGIRKPVLYWEGGISYSPHI